MEALAMDSGAQILRQVTAMVPQLRARGVESEELGRLHPDTMTDLRKARVFELLRPIEAGGCGLGLQDYVEVTRQLARGDASTAWVSAFFMGHAWILTKLGKDAQEEIFAGKPTALAAGTITQPGKATKVEGGYRVSGRWRFASGILHAEWVMLMAFTEQGPITAVAPVSAVTVHDSWQISGMKATGSNDISVEDLFVPDHLILPIPALIGTENPGSELYDYPFLRYPAQLPLTMSHAAIALGVADAAIELFQDSIGPRIRVPEGTRVAEEPAIQDIYAQALDERRCAELRLQDAIEIADAGYGAAVPELSQDRRADAAIAIVSAAVRAFRVVDLMVGNGGANIHRTEHALGRICRDVQVMRNHAVVDDRFHFPNSGRILLNSLEDRAAPQSRAGLKRLA